MKLYKTKMLIAPYKEDPKYWSDLVMRFSAYNVRICAGKFEDNMPVIIENCHATINSGGYGSDDITEERETGMKQTLLKLANVASGKQNELIVLTRNDGTVSSGVTGALKLWSDNRKADWATGTQFLTVSQAEAFLSAETRLGAKRTAAKRDLDLCYWCSEPDLLRKAGKFNVTVFCSPECKLEYQER